jgi:hypothetical protein
MPNLIYTTVIGVVAIGGTWLGNYVFNSPEKATAQIQTISEKISEDRQEISALKTQNENFEKWLSRIELKLDKVIDTKK